LKKTSSHKKNRVLVSLSGGVDSAVAAAILKKQGHDVVGAFFQFFDGAGAEKSLNNAKKIAKKLRILLKVVDAKKEFKKRIIDYFVSEYKNGRTPNLCVRCNKEMKFRLLFDLMRKEKADAVATGHYARIHITHNMEHITQKNMLRVMRCVLHEAKDRIKDQSYFLWCLTQKDLAKIVFPIGEYKKSEVKKMARKLKLPVVKNESQDICFLEGKSVSEFLKRRLRWTVGGIRDIGGESLGKHKGLPFYTIGQRKGIKIGGTGPYWVIRKNVRKNELLVTRDPKKLLTKKFFASEINWINENIEFPAKVEVQIRYRADKVSAIIGLSGKSGKLAIETEKPLRAVTPGQSAVFYKGGEVLGGGTIAEN